MSVYDRTIALLGEDNQNKLKNSSVIVFGVGGVGGYVVEALARVGVGSITIVDSDVIVESNINRQIIALHSNVGKDKVEEIKKRILDINTDIKVESIKMLYLPQRADEIDLLKYDMVVDCIDNITAKIDLAVRCKNLGVSLISSMGAGNRTDATLFKVDDIYNTKNCALSKVMRRELRKRNIEKLKVVYSTEEKIKQENVTDRKELGSLVTCVAVCGMLIAGEVIKDLLVK